MTDVSDAAAVEAWTVVLSSTSRLLYGRSIVGLNYTRLLVARDVESILR